MFSFFKSKKPSPVHTAEEPIPGPIPPAPRDDDFIFIEQKGSTPPSGITDGLYPNLPGVPVPAANSSGQVRQKSEEKMSHHLEGVPFKLAPTLAPDNNAEISQYQVNEILAFIARRKHSPLEYDFSLERSVLSDG
ncbi:uncharacterized protein LOC129777073 [Toxorhynchites rutilus septentrionalis]|uniref:uncharacterized protein LOC129777073 n=1 Tax=Toxorhynchites rutilus septentrionalis TaxID=329112 RepID=UPI00247A83FD|nr:uncharacterized protein LOC129777073 [Toxorhynchites rutilus septentrionalis]